MLAACAARLAERTDLVWVDLGGGTGVSFTSMHILRFVSMTYTSLYTYVNMQDCGSGVFLIDVRSIDQADNVV